MLPGQTPVAPGVSVIMPHLHRQLEHLSWCAGAWLITRVTFAPGWSLCRERSCFESQRCSQVQRGQRLPPPAGQLQTARTPSL